MAFLGKVKKFGELREFAEEMVPYFKKQNLCYM